VWRLLQHEYFPREPPLLAAGLANVHRLVDVTVKEPRRSFHLLHGNVLDFAKRQEDPAHSLLCHRRPHLVIVAHTRQLVATDDVQTIVLGHRTIRPALALASITAWGSFFSYGTYTSSHVAFVHRELTSALMTASNRSQSGAILAWSIRIFSGLPRHFGQMPTRSRPRRPTGKPQATRVDSLVAVTSAAASKASLAASFLK